MSDENKKELTLTRVFDAPREMVWKAWTDPNLVQQWWGPRGVTNPTCQWEAKPGGVIYIVMLAGQELGNFAGARWPMSGTIQEVEPPSRLVFTSQALMGVEEKPILETRCTVTLEQESEKTKVTVHIVVTKTTPEAEGPLQGMEMGWNQQMDKLGEFFKK